MKKTIIYLAALLSAGASLPAQAQFITSTVTSAAPFCREYMQNVVIGGRLQNGYGIACQQPDGSWKMQPPTQYIPVVQPMQPVQTVQTVQYVNPYPPAYYHRPAYSSFSISIGNNRPYYRPNKWHNNEHGRGHDRGHGRGRGHGRH